MNCKLTREKVKLSDYTSSINKEEEKKLNYFAFMLEHKLGQLQLCNMFQKNSHIKLESKFDLPLQNCFLN